MIASCRTFSLFIAEESRGPSPNKPEAMKPVRFAGGFFILAGARTIAERFATAFATQLLGTARDKRPLSALGMFSRRMLNIWEQGDDFYEK